jgi:hypothetical protein
MKKRLNLFLCSAPNFQSWTRAALTFGLVFAWSAQTLHADATWVGDAGQNWNNAASWSSDPANPTGNFLIDTNLAGIFPILSENSSFIPVDVLIGSASGSTGRLDQTAGSLSLANTTTNGNWFFVGRGGGAGTYNLANTAGTGGSLTGFATGSGSLTVGKLFAGGAYFFGGGTGTININTTGTITANSTQNISSTGVASVVLGTGAGSSGTINLDNGTVQANSEAWVGNGGSGNFNQSGGVLNTTGALYIGRQTGSSAFVMTGGTVNAGAAVDIGWGSSGAGTQQGTLTIGTGATFNSEGDLRTGYAGSATSQAFVNMNGGTLNVGSTTKRWMVVGQWDSTNSTINVASGNLNLNTNTDLRMKIGNNGGGTNIVNLNGGAITSFSDNKITANGSGVVDLMQTGTASTNNTFNLNGGTLTIREVVTTSNVGTATFNFNGGTLKATGATGNFIDLGGAGQTAKILAGGAKIDSNGFNVTVVQPLLAGGGGGGLVKQGSGKLTLAGVNTYTGSTNIQGGTLALGSTGSIDNSSGVSLGTSGTFDVSAKNGYAVGSLIGAGNVLGALTITSQLAIGNSPGTINFSGDLTLGAASTYTYEFIGGGTDADLGNVGGNLAIGVGAVLDLVQLGTYTMGDKFTLFSYAGNQSGTFAGLADDSVFTAGGGDWLINYNDTAGGLNGGSFSKFVTLTAVPEPSAVLLGSLGMLYLLRRRRP